jgi:cytochrome c oxidase cbb3-type subunit 3
MRADYLATAADAVDETNVTRLSDEASIAEGLSIFKRNCVACHLESGGGSVGPNLTDEYWIHGGGINNIFSVIKHGVPEKGMISWKTQLTPRQIQQVASYIMTLEGTKPADAKAPEGELYVASDNKTDEETADSSDNK